MYSQMIVLSTPFILFIQHLYEVYKDSSQSSFHRNLTALLESLFEA